MYQKLFKKIDELEPSFLDFWEDVCNIESPTGDKGGVDAVGNYFAAWAERRGFEVERFSQPVAGDVVIITMNPEAGGAPVALSGHMDTVHPVGTFGTPAVRREGKYIYGPGVVDCKGGIVAAAMAMQALQELGYTDRRVMLLLQSNEENSGYGGKATIWHICERAKDAVAFLNLEGANEKNGQFPNLATVARKGILTITFAITGIEAHSSRCATDGASAIAEAAYKLLEMEKLKDADGLTCNCGIIKGGTVANTVPGYCEFKANIRFANAAQLQEVREYARRVAERVFIEGCRTEIRETGFRMAMEPTDKNLALLAKMNEIYAACGLPQLTAYHAKGGSDAAEATSTGLPCVDSIGTDGGRIHSPEEYARIASLAEAAKRIAAVTAGF